MTVTVDKLIETIETKPSFDAGERAWSLRDTIRTRLPTSHVSVTPPTPPETEWTVRIEMAQVETRVIRVRASDGAFRLLAGNSFANFTHEEGKLLDQVVSAFQPKENVPVLSPEQRIDRLCALLHNALPTAAINVCSRPTERHWAARVQLGAQSRLIDYLPASGFRMNWKPEDGKDLAVDTFDETYAVAQVVSSLQAQDSEIRAQRMRNLLREALPDATITISKPAVPDKEWCIGIRLAARACSIRFRPAEGYRIPNRAGNPFALESDEAFVVREIVALFTKGSAPLIADTEEKHKQEHIDLSEVSLEDLKAEIKAREPETLLLGIEQWVVSLREGVNDWRAHRRDKVLKPDQVESMKEGLRHDLLTIRALAKQLFFIVDGGPPPDNKIHESKS